MLEDGDGLMEAVTSLVVAKQRLKSDLAPSSVCTTPEPRAVLCRHGVDELRAARGKARPLRLITSHGTWSLRGWLSSSAN